MKKILTLFAALVSVMVINAQMPTAMRFVGNADYVVNTKTAVSNEVDTVTFEMNGMVDGNITLPAVTYGQMVLPSFTISKAPFSMGADQVVKFSEYDFTAGDVAGTLKSGSYSMATSKFELVVEYQITGMPFPVTLTFSGYYVKPYTYKQTVTVGDDTSVTLDDIVYDVRKYEEDGTTYVDVALPTYVCEFGVVPMGKGTINIGSLTVGAYTVRHLEYDESIDAFYRDFKDDGLTMYVKDENLGLDDNYPLTGDIALTYSADGRSICVVSKPQPGAMPLTLTMVFNPDFTGISEVRESKSSRVQEYYNLAGQKVGNNAKGIVIINGKKVVK